MTDGGADAVRTGVSAADDQNVFAFRIDGRFGNFAGQESVLPFKQFKGKMNAAELTPGNGQITCFGSPDGDDDRIKPPREPVSSGCSILIFTESTCTVFCGMVVVEV